MIQSHKPNLIKFFDESASEELHLVLRGHLLIEALLNEIIQRSFEYPNAIRDLRQSFFTKVKMLRAVNRIGDGEQRVLLAVNSLRNKMAHQLHFKVTFSDSFDLVQVAAQAGIDFSDDTIHADRKLSEEWYGTAGVLTEVISNTFQHLVWMNEELFSKEDISDFFG